MFDSVNIVAFFVDLNEYNLVMYEDESTNRMVESLNLWEEIINSRWLQDSSFLLIFTKPELFEENLNTSKLYSLFQKNNDENNNEKGN